ncbi:MAG TPA: ketoacyl-ACP synthase III, partial [Polyangiaceae bacterium LLY-WYZ-15_(1-7)]|nr:ketoacyl-ACP synthase III [Polyangiaceae bacterium LLY-WYZ-15_(1-7)]
MRVLRPAAFGRGVRLLATGAALPARVVTNADLVALGAPLEPEEMEKLTGIRERRWVEGDEATSDLAVGAAREALGRASVAAEDVARLVLATVSPDRLSPSAACVAHAKLGLGAVPVHDLTASCSGFVYALDAAARAVLTGDAPTLAIGADVRSRFVDPTDRATCALFGDGAAAALLGEGPPDEGLLAIGLTADGRGAESVYVPAGGSREPASAETVEAGRHTIRMAEGPRVYLEAVEGMIGTAEALLEATQTRWEDLALVVPHQPNRRILDRLARLGDFDADKLVVDIEDKGNMSAASVGVALDRALRERARVGDLV